MSKQSTVDISFESLALVATVGILQHANNNSTKKAAAATSARKDQPHFAPEEVEIASLLKAARTGRHLKSARSCLQIYGSECPQSDWQQLEDGAQLLWLFWS